MVIGQRPYILILCRELTICAHFSDPYSTNEKHFGGICYMPKPPSTELSIVSSSPRSTIVVLVFQVKMRFWE